MNVANSRIGPQAMAAIHVHFEDFEDSRVMVVQCGRAAAPVFVKDGDMERFYIRTGSSTTELSASQTQDYIKHRYAG